MAHTAAVVICQVRVTLAGQSAPAFAMALNISAANFGIALGAAIGGWVATRWGIGAIGWGPVGMLPLIVGLAATLGARQEFRPRDAEHHRVGLLAGRKP